MSAARILAEYVQHLERGATRLEGGEELTEDWRRARRELDDWLRSADGLGDLPNQPEGAQVLERHRAAGDRFVGALRARMALVEDSIAESGRSRRAHRTYIGRAPARPARYLQQRS